MRRRRLRHNTALAWGLVGISTVLLTVAVLVLFAATRQSSPVESATRTLEVSLDQNEPLEITYVGDSLAAGLYATTEEDTYRSLTSTTLADGGPYEETGRNLVGGTVKETLDGNSRLPADQDVYIVELGTNDINEVDFRRFRAQYDTLLERLRRTSPDAALVCLGTWRPPSKGANYDLIIRQRCEAYGGVYRRLSDLQGEPKNRGPEGEETFEGTSDTFHPNDVGHAAISERILDAVEVQRSG